MTEGNNTTPRRGRRPLDPPWYADAATLVANGTPLRQALGRLGIQLSERELQNVYRHVRFRQYLDEERVNRWRVRCYEPVALDAVEAPRSGDSGNPSDENGESGESFHDGNGGNPDGGRVPE